METVAVSAYGVRIRAAQVAEIFATAVQFQIQAAPLRHCHSKLLEISRYLGDGSNQTAELHAMRESFILARPGDTIFSDPRYAVMLITGHCIQERTAI